MLVVDNEKFFCRWQQRSLVVDNDERWSLTTTNVGRRQRQIFVVDNDERWLLTTTNVGRRQKPWHGVTVLTKLIERKQMGRRQMLQQKQQQQHERQHVCEFHFKFIVFRPEISIGNLHGGGPFVCGQLI